MIQELIDRLFEWLQRRCKHDPLYVTADLTQGDGYPEIKWCQRCGAYCTYGNWYSPHATWTGETDRRRRRRDARTAA